jgi:hypothetical protein
MEVRSEELLNQFYFSGSFFKGTGQGAADPAVVGLVVESDASPSEVAVLADAALVASPAHAALAEPLRNTFALYVNGRRCPVTRVPPPGVRTADPTRCAAAPSFR